MDFKSNVDKIELSKLIYTALGKSGTLNADAFFISASAEKGADKSDRIVYNSTTGALYYDADGSGAGSAVQIAIVGVTTHPTLSYLDFGVIA